MENKEKDTPEKEATNTNKILDKTTETFKWWNRLSSINAEDPIWLGFLKISFRIVGILIMLLISPFVILGLLLGITAAL